MRLRLLAALLAATLLAACGDAVGDGVTPEVPTQGGSAAPGDGVGIPEPDDIDPGRLAPLAGLPTCPDPPTSLDGADAGDLPLPEDAVLTASSIDGPLLNVQGYTPRTPVEVLVAYLRLDDWTVLSAEDEVFEAEILLERDGLRVFAKAQATCERGSAFVLFGSSDPALVPAPQGG